ncbi:MAG: glutamate 5-kinase, partial [Pseudomonadota bacterium]
RATIRALFKEQAIPVINENDTVATTQIRYGDNDRLAARLATMISADLLILLSDVDGLYTADPTFDPDASHLPCIRHITPEIERLAGASTSPYASGGMATKIDAARIAIQGGCAMLVADGRKALPLSRLATDRFTIFEASLAPQPARKRWIAGSLNVTGYLRLDDGAIKALRAGKSLLAAGIAGSSGQFERGDHVRLETLSGMRFAVAITSYNSDEIARIRGQQSRDIARILGYDRGPAIIHRDDLALDEPSDSS